jgi:hypothetical protein
MEQWTFVWYNGIIISAPVIGDGVAEYLLLVLEKTTEAMQWPV